MKKIALNLKAVVGTRSEVAGLLANPGDAVMIQRGHPRWIMLKCPCGCGEEIPINLDARAGKAWRFYERRSRGATLFPSVWRDTGCQSHFIVWNNCILLLDAEGSDESAVPENIIELAQRVRSIWPASALVSYVDVADQLGEIPWDVMESCRYLVREGLLVEGSGQQRSMFRLR
jgi:hypothetical protein